MALFTPAAGRIFNLIAGDYGRPISDITSTLNYSNMLKDVELVLDKLTPVENEVSTIDNKVFLMRISPYRTTEDHINGVVITFVDITAIKAAEQQLHSNMNEISRFNAAMVTRETRMIDLKKEVNELLKRLGEPARYPLDFEREKKD